MAVNASDLEEGALLKLIAARFGIRTRAVANRELATIGTTVARILGNNPNRVGFTIINLGTNVVFVHFARDVSTTLGIRLGGAGAFVTLLYDEDFHLTGWEWFAVADAGAANNVLVIEVEGY